MPRFNIPTHMTVDAPSPEKAMEMAQKVQKLLVDPMVRAMLKSEGIAVAQIQVFHPTLTK
jgi:hypothetical protein